MKLIEMDSRVAEEIMGWKSEGTGMFTNPATGGSVANFSLPEYSTEVSAAFLVVVKLGHLGFNLGWMPNKQKWRAVFYHNVIGGDNWDALEDTPAYAITVAALLYAESLK